MFVNEFLAVGEHWLLLEFELVVAPEFEPSEIEIIYFIICMLTIIFYVSTQFWSLEGIQLQPKEYNAEFA